MSNYGPSGALFPTKEKKSEKSPDFSGKLELSDEVVNDLISQMERGVEKPIISLVGWRKTSKAGNNFVSLVGNVFKPMNSGGQQQPQRQQMNDEIPF
jgi:hypothetical protein